MAAQAGPNEFFSYSMDRNRRGIAVIIGIGTFDDASGIKNVPKTNKSNIEECETAFKRLHFDIKLCEDTTANGILSFLEYISNLNHEQYDCFVLYFSSHGGLGYLCCSDCKVGKKDNERRDGFIYITTLVDMFVKTETLQNKPKLFFFDGCRQDSQNIPVRQRKAPIELLSEENQQSTYADIFISYATVIGGSSLGPVEELIGLSKIANAYTTNLTACLNEFGRTISFSEVMNQVSFRMKTDADKRHLITEQNSTLCGSIVMKELRELKENDVI